MAASSTVTTCLLNFAVAFRESPTDERHARSLAHGVLIAATQDGREQGFSVIWRWVQP